MDKDTIVGFRKLGEAQADPLIELLRSGARQLIAEVVEAEPQAFLADYQSYKDSRGRRLVVRNGYQPERELQTVWPKNQSVLRNQHLINDNLCRHPFVPYLNGDVQSAD